MENKTQSSWKLLAATLETNEAEDDEEMGTTTKDWRKALRSQPAYRIVNRTIRGQTQFISFVAIIGLFILIILYLTPRRNVSGSSVLRSTDSGYNHTYPLTVPIKTSSMHTFRIAIISDLDEKSKSPTDNAIWLSHLMKGYLSYSPTRQSVVISWDRADPVRLTGSYALKNRGMELSELVVFDGKLLTFCDRTGLVYEIANDKAVPWLLLMDGDGRSPKGFKSEWATVKDEVLYVGSMGKEWTTPQGDFENHNPQFVKAVTAKGQVSHLNWVNEFKKVREVLGIHWPGYMIHESGVWSSVHRRWFFLPRRCSKEQYNESLDEHRGCSVLISANEDFSEISKTDILNKQPTRGFSSFKFIPTSQDEVIVALRTEELEGKTATYVTAFTIAGKTLLDDFHISDLKYEGLEFI